MPVEATTTAPQSVARTITHNQRAKSSDVNPLLQSSPQPITSADDNFIVGRQADGKLSHIVPGFKLSLKEKFLNSLEKYYEVDKRSYPFVLILGNMPSAQSTFKFTVSLEFNLKVVEPCAVVRENCTSLLDCIMLDLRRCVHGVTGKFHVRDVGQAETELQTALNSFNVPSFLQIVFGVIGVEPDEHAKHLLHELERQKMELELVGSRGEIAAAQGVIDKIVVKAADGIEDHQIQKLLPESVKGMINK